MIEVLARAIPGELLIAGGPALWVLLAMSVVALTIVLAKCMHFATARLGRNRDIEAALADWRAGRNERAVQRLEASPEPAAGVLATAMRGQMEGAPEERVREEVVRRASALLASLRGGLRPLDLIAQLSPLLGLLGTVLGMITAFQQLASAGSQADPALLSGGIWEALLTTAAGLIIAIPAMTAHAWLEGRVERFRHRLEDAVTRAFTQAPAASAAMAERSGPEAGGTLHDTPRVAAPQAATRP